MEVYIDLVVFLNFCVDLLLLLGTSRLLGYSPDYRRCILAAILGGGYAGLCLLPGISFLGSLFWRLVFWILVALLAFGLHPATVKQSGCFVLFSMSLSGFVTVMGRGGTLSVMLSALMLAGMYLLGCMDHNRKGGYATVKICHCQKQLDLRALIDTGNTLKDPVTGYSVLVVDSLAAYRLLGLQEEELQQPVETISRGKYPGLRLIPYCAVGQPSAMLLGLKTEELWVDGKRSQQIVAFAPQMIGRGNGYQALMGGNVC